MQHFSVGKHDSYFSFAVQFYQFDTNGPVTYDRENIHVFNGLFTFIVFNIYCAVCTLTDWFTISVHISDLNRIYKMLNHRYLVQNATDTKQNIYFKVH